MARAPMFDRGTANMTTDPHSTFRPSPQVIFGLAIVLFGLALLASNMHWIDISIGRIFQMWPLGFVAVGVVKILQAGTNSGRMFGGFLVLFGLWLGGGDWFGLHLRLSKLWPLAIIVLGALMISRAYGAGAGTTGTAATSGDHVGTIGDQVFSEFALWSGKQRRVSSAAFKHADLTAIMGGVEIDFRGASTAGAEAVVDVFAFWGGIEIRVPPDWVVVNQVVPIMGGAEDKSTGTPDSRNRLILRGFAIMGGIEVKS